jgi:hypothetical protein
MGFVTDRGESGRHAGGKIRLLKGGKPEKASPVALVKPHVPRSLAARRHNRQDD